LLDWRRLSKGIELAFSAAGNPTQLARLSPIDFDGDTPKETADL
jgi:hypothetical protein